MSQDPEAAVSITSARPSRSVDIRKRQMRYLLSMGVRTLCFVLAIVTTGPLRWSLVAGAVFLPYVAVVLANATDLRRGPVPPSFHNEDRLMIGPSSTDEDTGGLPPRG